MDNRVCYIHIFLLRLTLIYLSLTSVSLVTGKEIQLTNTGYRNLVCLSSPNFCDNVITRPGSLSEVEVTEEMLNDMREEFFRKYLFDSIYEWIGNAGNDIKAKLERDLKLGYIWLPPSNSTSYSADDFLYIALEMDEKIKVDWESDSSNHDKLERRKIISVGKNSTGELLYGNIKSGFAVFRDNERRECELNGDDGVHIDIVFEFVGGTYQVEDGKVSFPIVYIPILEIWEKK